MLLHSLHSKEDSNHGYYIQHTLCVLTLVSRFATINKVVQQCRPIGCLFLRPSGAMVAQATCNRQVIGSNPVWG